MAVNMAPSLASLQVAPQDRESLQLVWQNIQPDSCPHSYNFHTHTTSSDGRLNPQDLIDQAITIGLKGLAITDHHTISGYKIAQNWLQSLKKSTPTAPLPQLWTGVEITAKLLDTEVHILGYAFNPEYPSLENYLQRKAPQDKMAKASAVINTLQEAGGFAILAHPARYRRSAQELIPAAADLGIDGVEVYYAYGNPDPWEPTRDRTEQVKALSANYNLLHTCGTDTHGLSLLRRL
ncbi:MAG TPA: PHP domain-containing protein [Cyanobacteria bacterium UBA11149]|nr:PHP domain-containing protein [Cyanobacteria bacterium UBA11367]HBE58354.1 PHP domain-containing protein [Cyanobacteria bacterium UBA11366]HBK62049.1 PHP domain-containing protein [Cyanobacteria bacterium UBA11166]HBR73891.1 PHP domain-containing protein [Cyanobacteria bacterium UBA11159]HBS71203.1 PHP domain-containing protein [Cyanobacteria bacterium UBA11153]HBW89245.1 PHP domain-containing protein [Cyanobacteria bacterium UBA11149]HCA94703.1 PHP domain-containing protein [Cyanobacteria